MILVYVWFRFEWQFAVGAIIATIHDIVMTMGFFVVSGIEFNQSSIAAILTIVGYSLERHGRGLRPRSRGFATI